MLVKAGAVIVRDHCQYTSTNEGTPVPSVYCAAAQGAKAHSDSTLPSSATITVMCRCNFTGLNTSLRHAERDLLRLYAVFAVCHSEQCRVIPCRQFACPFHLHGVFLSGKEALLRAFSLGRQLAV